MINLEQKKRIVDKIGSNILTDRQKNINIDSLKHLVEQICFIKDKNIEVVVVSSGAIASGSAYLGFTPTTISEKQAAAAVGQVVLMENYQKEFNKRGYKIAQILLTKDGIMDEKRANLASNTFKELIQRKVIPIVNENDSVAIEEIRFSDNDNLSSLVSVLINADLQIFLTDIDGLYDLDPRCNKDAKLLPRITELQDNLIESIDSSASGAGKGGMRSKVKAAKYLMENGIDVIIANGLQKNILMDIYNGKTYGTKFICPKKGK